MTTAATGVPSPIVSATTPPSASSASSAGTTLAGNFQAFLTILTTQLKNQNPLDPLDSNQFTQQLVQFAGVEQQLKTNSELAALQQSAQSTQALAFVGRMAVVDGNTANLTLESIGALVESRNEPSESFRSRLPATLPWDWQMPPPSSQ